MIYTELEDVYAALIAAVHVDPARRVPQEWRDTLAGGVYKGKGKPIDGITSYRWLCFTSGLAKLYEAFLLYRAEPTVFPDEGQSIGCNGVDVRQLIVLIMERAVEREARKLTTLMLMDDDSPNATAVTGTSGRHAVALPEARHAHDRACFGNDFFVCCSPRKPKGAGKRVKQYAPKAAAMPPPAPRPPEPPPPQEETFGPMAVMKLLYPSLYS